MKPIQKVVDETGAIHTLTRRIGAGSQGEVWLTEGGKRIVKLLGRHNDPEALRRQFSFVRRLDLTGLHVARPIAVLKQPYIGYVAEFLSDMMSIKEIIEAPQSNLTRWHIDTGGLRRRLRLLAHIGEALAGLHARGVVYADVSHHNVFISKTVNAVEAWLIDLDNLSYESDPRRAIYTPGYGAPEIVAGTAGCTTLSDSWGFAVLVWQTLTLTHPFIGDYVNDGEPELEEQAFSGKLPWVKHSKDDLNGISNRGLPPELVMGTPPANPSEVKRNEALLINLARKTFEFGIHDRKARPGVAEWIEALHDAADKTINCPQCLGTYYAKEATCSWCEASRPKMMPVRIAYWHPDKGLVEGAMRLGQFPLTSEGLILPRRVTQGLTGVAAREGHVEIKSVDNAISVQALPGFDAWVAPILKAKKEHHSVTGRRGTVPSEGWMVFFDEPNKPQRVALLGRTP